MKSSVKPADPCPGLKGSSGKPLSMKALLALCRELGDRPPCPSKRCRKVLMALFRGMKKNKGPVTRSP